MKRDPQSIMEELDALLEKERALLLTGKLDDMADILSAKEALIDALSAADQEDMQDLAGLQNKLTRNQTLLDGALHGIRRTTARLAALRRVRRSLETYNEAGDKQTIEGRVTRKLERRA